MRYKLNFTISNKRHVKTALYALVTLALFFIVKHWFTSSGRKNDKAVSVATAVAKNADIPIYVTAIGTVTAEYTVTVTSQANGKLIKLFFKEGQKVKAGDLLAEIDAKPYQAQLTQYEGQLARDNALLTNAKLDLRRYQELWKQNSISKQILDTQASLVHQYEGTVAMDKGLVENAKVNLSYCLIVAPIAGQIGLRQIDEGNIIQTTTNPNIAIINTITPITVIFSIPENTVHKVITQFNRRDLLEVIAYDHEQSQQLASGELLAIDNQIDTATGTVRLKAIFKNDDGALFPNQFVNVSLLIDILKDVIIVPTSAIQYNPNGSFVYIVGTDSKVKTVPVKIGITNNNDTVVSSGVSVNDVVVTEGVDRLTDGILVKTGNSP